MPRVVHPDTGLCCFNLRGYCKFGDRCKYIHGDDDGRPCIYGENCNAGHEDRTPLKCCEFLQRGVCRHGILCKFEHSREGSWRCEKGDYCPHQHYLQAGEDDDEEETEEEDDPDEVKCCEFLRNGHCKFGDECRYLHSINRPWNCHRGWKCRVGHPDVGPTWALSKPPAAAPPVRVPPPPAVAQVRTSTAVSAPRFFDPMPSIPAPAARPLVPLPAVPTPFSSAPKPQTTGVHSFGVASRPQTSTSAPLAQKAVPLSATAKPPSSQPANARGLCAICTQLATLLSHRGCFHTPDHCQDCLREHIAVRMRDTIDLTIRCPSFRCTTNLEIDVLQQYAARNAFEAYSLRLTQKMLSDDQDTIYCSNPKCGCHLSVDNGHDQPVATCPYCRQKTCFKCHAPWHRGESCDAYRMRVTAGNAQHAIDEKRTQEFLSQNTRKCPKCGTGPCAKEKAECDVATCPQCKPRFRFCWECAVDYDLIFKTCCKSHKPNCKYYA